MPGAPVAARTDLELIVQHAISREYADLDDNVSELADNVRVVFR